MVNGIDWQTLVDGIGRRSLVERIDRQTLGNGIDRGEEKTITRKHIEEHYRLF